MSTPRQLTDEETVALRRKIASGKASEEDTETYFRRLSDEEKGRLVKVILEPDEEYLQWESEQEQGVSCEDASGD